jgi:hypothetical protein
MFTVFGRGEIEMGLKCAWNLIFSLGEKQSKWKAQSTTEEMFPSWSIQQQNHLQKRGEQGRKFGHIIEWIYNFSYCFGLFSILTGENFQ